MQELLQRLLQTSENRLCASFDAGPESGFTTEGPEKGGLRQNLSRKAFRVHSTEAGVSAHARPDSSWRHDHCLEAGQAG